MMPADKLARMVVANATRSRISATSIEIAEVLRPP